MGEFPSINSVAEGKSQTLFVVFVISCWGNLRSWATCWRHFGPVVGNFALVGESTCGGVMEWLTYIILFLKVISNCLSFFLFICNSNHVQMHMLKNKSLDIFVNKAQKHKNRKQMVLHFQRDIFVLT